MVINHLLNGMILQVVLAVHVFSRQVSAHQEAALAFKQVRHGQGTLGMGAPSCFVNHPVGAQNKGIGTQLAYFLWLSIVGGWTLQLKKYT